MESKLRVIEFISNKGKVEEFDKIDSEKRKELIKKYNDISLKSIGYYKIKD